MTESQDVILRTTGPEGDLAVVQEYVFDAITRLEKDPECEGIGFVPLARKGELEEIGLEGGVLIQIIGDDTDRLVQREQTRWDALVEEGLIEEWTLQETEVDLGEYMGPNGADLYHKLSIVTSKLSETIYQELDHPLQPVDEYPHEERESRTGVGWWRLLHLLTIQQNYSYEEEIEAFAEAIRFSLHNIALFDSRDQAMNNMDQLIESLHTVRDELDELEIPGGT